MRRPQALISSLDRFVLLSVAAGLIGAVQPGHAAQDSRTEELSKKPENHATTVSLQNELRQEEPEALAQAARKHGDPMRGAVVFYQRQLACAECHLPDDKGRRLGPDLARPNKNTSGAHIVESLLQPSKTIRKGYEAATLLTKDGKTLTGLLLEETPDTLILGDTQRLQTRTVPKAEIAARNRKQTSLMPAGLANQMGTRQQFLDLVRYLTEIAEEGPARARELRPPESLIARPPLPEYEKHIDHAGLIRDLGEENFERGRAIYNRLCANCHGTHERRGSLPDARRFFEEEFKNGSDPYSMYRTLTYGFGRMAPQTWMVPRQKYDVIHYIREAYLQEDNPGQYVAIDRQYLSRLPEGETRGPEPSNIGPWANMNYGPHLTASFEVGRDGSNIAYKGIAVRLDPGPGGVSRGRHWIVYDHDTLRAAGAWSGEEFCDWNSIRFNGRHGVHPHALGEVHFANPTGPGWADPETHDFDDPRLRGRDDRPYGPLPRDWAHYEGMYHFGNRVILSYTVGKTRILEMPGLKTTDAAPVITRTFKIGPRPDDLVLQVAHRNPGHTLRLLKKPKPNKSKRRLAVFAPRTRPATAHDDKPEPFAFDGRSFVDVAGPGAFDLTGGDYSITARVKTEDGGTIIAKAPQTGDWMPNGKSLFIRGGRLVFDIGWVGAVTSQRRVDDGRWHDVAMTWDRESARVRLYIDGRLDAEGTLRPKDATENHVVRLGYTSPDFPEQQSSFRGRMHAVRFYSRRLDSGEVTRLAEGEAVERGLLARWDFEKLQGKTVPDATGSEHDGTIRRDGQTASRDDIVVAGLAPGIPGAEWLSTADGDLRLRLPACETPLRFTLWTAAVGEMPGVTSLSESLDFEQPGRDLEAWTNGGPPRWPARLETQPELGDANGPFAVDVLAHPRNNPWFCRMRFTAFDFFPQGRRAAVCTWDGDVWLADGVDDPGNGLTWQRIASGLFQPLGLKIVDGKIHVTCRDQIVVLHDLNGDGETDFYENFNNDHQVTEHFHEFATGLQTDAEGNFYYAKAGRHGKRAVVPHHGTLLRVGPDGSETEIVATGFRAPNGVCVNPDGTFFMTDQEGHWTPKNRINHVREGGFYGYMWGYHDVEDTADSAMQPPVCWITNEFDRSPAEPLWVPDDAWGPLGGTLLNFSYGYGKIFTVPHETFDGRTQGGVSPLPLPRFPTGLVRGRFHPADGQLYTCGMFAWAGDQQQPGGFYRVRYTGEPVHVPTDLKARRRELRITFSGRLDRASAGTPENYSIRVWSLKRTAEYGSEHYNERALQVADAELSEDGRTVTLAIPQLAETQGMAIRYSLKSVAGKPVESAVHNTIHRLPAADRPRDR